MAIGSWVEREPCGMTEIGTYDRLVPVLGFERQSIAGKAAEEPEFRDP
jgi:hypothetical protein